ncbi:MAG TPA: glycosyl transferase family 36 [Rhodanobacteraceae bacterium]|nr:glycosyl transferase family 36 [Rhodanobacteraceae bacterium]
MPADAQSLAATVHLLGSGDYAVMLAASGAGYSHWKGHAVTRWQAGQVGGEQGGYVYVRGGAAWSATAQPVGGQVRYWFGESIARFARRDGALTTTFEVAVDPGRAVEIRGIGLRNDGAFARSIEVTSYAELVLGSATADIAHPAFSKMFVQTAIEDGVLLARRRKRDASDPAIWAAHALIVDGGEDGEREFETDRARFIGRGRSLGDPVAMQPGVRLSGTAGTVLDPIFSLRARLTVAAGATRRAAFVTAVAESREEVLKQVRRYLDPAACAEVFARARDHAPDDDGAPIAPAEAALCQRLAGALVYDDPTLRPARDVIAKGEGGAPVLWAAGISGDLPIVVARIAHSGETALVEDLLRAQAYWRDRQLPADLVVLVTAGATDADAAEAALKTVVSDQGEQEKARGSVFVLRADRIEQRLLDGLLASARVVLDGGNGRLAEQSACAADVEGIARTEPAAATPPVRGGKPASLPAPAELDFWNGLGGFTKDGREYVVVLHEGATTPVPWSHVVAGPGFGFLVTATGGGYTWAINSQQNQITPWSNDAVCDPCGDCVLLRDLEDGGTWSATAAPSRAGGATYVARFGPGYARFDANVHGIESELIQCAAVSDPVKLSRLRLHNRGRRPRRIAVAAVANWRLGPIGHDPRPTTQVDPDATRGAVFVRNALRPEFADEVAFVACGADGAQPTSDQNLRSAVVAIVELAPGDSRDLLFLLGEGRDRAAAEQLVDRYRDCDFDAVLAETGETWNSVLDPLQIETPHHSLDLLVNRCLPYQVLACRLWARTGFYQASGAFGFRDQLQDVGALCIARPDLAREHILLAASRQFEEGDTQHWWLPPTGKGVRTRIVDDRLWLPFTVAHYIETTGDEAILAAKVPFLHGDALATGQADAFFQPERSARTGTLFEHCALAIDTSFATGVHGLPLIGTGDWNDGMNRVGVGGKGESVWMAWFLCKVIADFAPFAEARGDLRAARWRDHVRALQLAAETKAWDGAWYRRAFYDDGTPLGTSADTECRVESMAQSWAVISGAGDPERAGPAMRAVNEYLVRPGDGLVALFTEPFDETPHDPGYIKGYPPGLRENGGQYTHGSIWSLIAFAMLGDGDKAGELLEIFDPIRKSDTPEKTARYKVEPYVECADVYSVAPHVGRGGWTWYTGSAGWLYRAIVEWVLGIRLRGDKLLLAPCVPRRWKGFAFTYRHGNTQYRVEVENPGHVCRGIASVEVDGVRLQDPAAGVELQDDGQNHLVHATMSLQDPDR